MLRVEMLSTGDEVLHGQIVDTNAAWLADTLFQHGLPLTSRATVGDSLNSLVAVLAERSQIADVLIVNGGLGPTSDDLTAQAAATACDVALVRQDAWLQKITNFFAQHGREMPPANVKQADIPAGAELLDNPVGTACGFALHLHRCWMFFTPGVPVEFRMMVEQQILPRLKAHFTLPAPPLCLRLTTFGRSESELAMVLASLSLPEGVVVGYRSAQPVIEIKLTGPAAQSAAMKLLWQQIQQRLADSVLFTGMQGLPAQLAEDLRATPHRLVTGEQYTAGLLHWQLAGADAPLQASGIWPRQPETLVQLVQRAQQLAVAQQATLALVTGSGPQQQPVIVLHTPAKVFVRQLRFTHRRYSRQMRQQIIAIMAMSMLQRWLQGREIDIAHHAIEVVSALEQLPFS